MHVLNVNHSLDLETGGGTAERTFQMSRFLASGNDVKCTVLVLDIGLDQSRIDSIAPAEVIALTCVYERFYVPRISWRTLRDLVRKADIVHLMGHWSILNALVYLACRFSSKPYIVCPAGALPIFGRSTILKKVYNWIIGRKIIQKADAWIAVTEDEKSQFIPYGIDAAKVIVIPNGINSEDFPDGGVEEFRKKHGIHKNLFMLFLGRLNIIKGPDLLLEAFIKGKNDWQDWHLVYAGPDGGLLESLKRTVIENGLGERVHFIGYVGGIEKSAAYRAADLLVIPSRQEAMSIVVLEAGISATPVVLTDQCGFNQVEKIGGGKVSPATANGIHNSLLELLKDTGNLAKMGGVLESYVKKHFAWSIVIRKYIDLYNKIIDVT